MGEPPLGITGIIKGGDFQEGAFLGFGLPFLNSGQKAIVKVCAFTGASKGQPFLSSAPTNTAGIGNCFYGSTCLGYFGGLADQFFSKKGWPAFCHCIAQ